MDVEVNYVAVLFAGLSSMVVGSIWYARNVFGDRWAKLAHVDMNKKVSSGEMGTMMGMTLLASLVTAFVLAHVTYLSNHFFGGSFLSSALQTAFWAWLGFTAARVLTHDLFERRPRMLTLLTFGHELVTVLVMALIIGVMKP